VLPVVHVYVWSGTSKEAKRRIVSGITKVFEELGIPPQAVEVLVFEVPKESWGVGGELASERFKDVNPP
jgi:4-oxalocrotonate tautomerase